MKESPQLTDVTTTNAAAKEHWHAPLCKVTSLSKILAAIVFITLPFVGFWLGMGYGNSVDTLPVEMPVIETPEQPMSVPESTITVGKINWNIETADPTITDEDSFKKYEQAIAIEVTYSDNSTSRHDLGAAYGCTGTTTMSVVGDKTVLGKDDCYFSLSGVVFTAYTQNGKFIVDRGEESAKDGTVELTKLVEVDIVTKKSLIALSTVPALTTAEQEAQLVVAEEEAKKLSSKDLEAQLVAGLTSLVTKYDVVLGLKMTGYLREYSSIRKITNPQIESLQDQLTNSLGPCWGIPEGNCRE